VYLTVCVSEPGLQRSGVVTCIGQGKSAGVAQHVPVLAYAQDTSTGVLKLPQDIEFKSPLPGSPQTGVLYGDPTKPGVFVSRVKFSAGWKDPPHWHPDEVRTVVVLSGTLYFGSGDKWDESKFKAYPAGTFYSEPPRAPHFSWAKDGEVIIQITGIGPSGKTFIPQQ
jgi:quercetin dioxygenase-like cupin family protein